MKEVKAQITAQPTKDFEGHLNNTRFVVSRNGKVKGTFEVYITFQKGLLAGKVYSDITSANVEVFYTVERSFTIVDGRANQLTHCETEDIRVNTEWGFFTFKSAICK